MSKGTKKNKQKQQKNKNPLFIVILVRE